MAIAEPQFATVDDDLPRTLRREREARERARREREGPTLDPHPARRTDATYAYASPSPEPGQDADVAARPDLPFFYLMGFFIKAVVAAVPALILLAGLLWLGGQGLSAFFPQIPKMQILIHFPTAS